jgi:uncharacterized protein HemY
MWGPALAGPVMGKTLVLLGLLIAGIGVLVMLGVPIGRLPGDIYYRRGQTTVYVPLMTSILISVVLSLVFWLFRR